MNTCCLFAQVVVDNTNPERKDRAEYIKLAKKHKVPVRCFQMNVTHNHALHNNRVSAVALLITFIDFSNLHKVTLSVFKWQKVLLGFFKTLYSSSENCVRKDTLQFQQ